MEIQGLLSYLEKNLNIECNPIQFNGCLLTFRLNSTSGYYKTSTKGIKTHNNKSVNKTKYVAGKKSDMKYWGKMLNREKHR